MMPIILWTFYFLLEQGYRVIENLLLQDNRSSILLERNDRASSSKHTRHINIRYFFISDQVNMKEVTINWCPTKQMVADFMTKPLQGYQFRNLRDYIMGRIRSTKPNNNVIKAVKQDGRTPFKKLIKKTSKVTGRGHVKLVTQLWVLLFHSSVLGFIRSQTANDSSLGQRSLLLRQGQSHNSIISLVSSDKRQHPAIVTALICLQIMNFFHRIGCRESQTYFRGTDYRPCMMGLGQGNRAVPLLWI
jgi:hypothetical protein